MQETASGRRILLRYSKFVNSELPAPIFLRSGDLETELENRQMMTTVELAKKLGWRGALESIYAPDEIAYMSDANRCKFLDLLSLSKDNTIALEIGCGLGQHTAAIARRVKHLDVLEVRLLVANKIL